MSNKLKYFICGVVVSAMVTTNIIPALASAMSKTIQVTYNDIKITMNGKQITPRDGNGNIVEPFVYEGTTYLPVRGIATALDLSVVWDGETNTVKLSDGSESVQVGWSKDNPAPIGTRINIDSVNFKGNISVAQIIRGEEANNILLENNSFAKNSIEKLAPDEEMLLVKFLVTVNKENKSFNTASSINLVGYSGYNDKLDINAYGVPKGGDGTSMETIKSGDSGDAWRCYVVKKSDTQPKVNWGTTNKDDTVWFKLYN